MNNKDYTWWYMIMKDDLGWFRIAETDTSGSSCYCGSGYPTIDELETDLLAQLEAVRKYKQELEKADEQDS